MANHYYYYYLKCYTVLDLLWLEWVNFSNVSTPFVANPHTILNTYYGQPYCCYLLINTSSMYLARELVFNFPRANANHAPRVGLISDPVD